MTFLPPTLHMAYGTSLTCSDIRDWGYNGKGHPTSWVADRMTEYIRDMTVDDAARVGHMMLSGCKIVVFSRHPESVEDFLSDVFGCLVDVQGWITWCGTDPEDGRSLSEIFGGGTCQH